MNAPAVAAIETHYRGYRFRSRLEARWAMFFDAVGVSWGYETDPLDVNGEAYLPDFRVQIDGTEIVHEVKPESAAGSIRPMKVYLGGKMSADREWRGPASVTDRGKRYVADSTISRNPYFAWQDASFLATMGGATFILIGPFPSGCDHGCAHRPESLHLAQTCSESITSAKWIVRQCFSAIMGSDVFCAHIDGPDAFGTLVEIGMTSLLATKVCVTFARSLLETHPRKAAYDNHGNETGGAAEHDLWFAGALAEMHGGERHTVDSAEEARSFHAAFINRHTSREYRLISAIGQTMPAALTFGDPLHVYTTDIGHSFRGGGALGALVASHEQAAKAVRAHRFDSR